MITDHQVMLQHVNKNIPLMVIYAGMFAALWWFSRQLETIPGAVSWFLPAGFRLAALALIPRKRWWSLWVAEVSSSVLLTKLDFAYNGIVSAVAAAALPMPIYAVALVATAQVTGNNDQQRIRHFPTLAVASLAGAVVYSIVWTTNLMSIGVATSQQTSAFLVGIPMGDLVGISVSLPLLMLVLEERSWQTVTIMAGLGLASVSIAASIDLGPQRYNWRLILLLGVAVSAHRYGLVGACMSSWSTSVLIVASQVFDANLGTTEDNQLAIVFLTFGGLALGYSVSKNDLLSHQLAHRNDELSRLNADYQQLASRLVDVSEQERNAIARDVHDGLGQMLASMRIKLALIRSSVPTKNAMLEDLDKLLASTYDTARTLMNQLTPNALMDLGLDEALRASDIEGLCHQVGTQCHFDIQKNQPLDKALQLQLFRIIQEAAHNCAKYAHASRLVISLRTHENQLTLTIKDDGQGFDVAFFCSGRGLSNISDRAALINASHSLTSSPEGTEHTLLLTLDNC